MGPPTILIVEPVPMISAVLVRIVAVYAAHAVPVIAHTVHAARHILQTRPVTAVITDDRFCDGTSVDVLAAAHHHAVPVVVIADGPHREASARAAGAAAFLTKPFDVDPLLTALHAMIEGDSDAPLVDVAARRAAS